MNEHIACAAERMQMGADCLICTSTLRVSNGATNVLSPCVVARATCYDRAVTLRGGKGDVLRPH